MQVLQAGIDGKRDGCAGRIAFTRHFHPFATKESVLFSP